MNEIFLVNIYPQYTKDTYVLAGKTLIEASIRIE